MSHPTAEAAHAKINLFLHVTGRRADGYHLLDSLVAFAGAHDRVSLGDGATPGELALELAGPFGGALRDGGADTDNLVLRAARLLAAEAGEAPTARLVLDKHLPVASGIGGGSADAAATLRLLRRAWNLEQRVDATALQRLALSLGADVPVCVEQAPARMRGIGEELHPAPVLPPCGIVLVNCGVGVSTPAVFRALTLGNGEEAVLPALWPDADGLCADLRRCRNDLEAPARALCPPIGEVLDALAAQPDCLLARMSGSGATCFGLFRNGADAEAAAAALRRPGWWCHGGPLLVRPPG
jgi:4-diphosphocytidyl-2-C-methyl-D-erythritol kinase